MAERLRNRIRIVETPPGEAPLPIREEWVETIIPTSREYADIADAFFPGSGEKMPDDSEMAIGTGSFGVESGSLSDNDNTNGYIVNALDAIAALESKGNESAKTAAEYWRKTLSYFGSLEGEQLVFSRRVCELLASDQKPKE